MAYYEFEERRMPASMCSSQVGKNTKSSNCQKRGWETLLEGVVQTVRRVEIGKEELLLVLVFVMESGGRYLRAQIAPKEVGF